MIDSFPTIEIMERNEAIEFIENYPNMDEKFVELGSKVMIIYRHHQKDVDTLLNGYNG
jgi:hypothetical protein